MSLILLPPATIGIGFAVLLIAVAVFTWNQLAELLRSYAHEEQVENIGKPSVDQKKQWKSEYRPCFIVIFLT